MTMKFLSSVGVLWDLGGKRIKEWERFGEMTGLVFTGERTHAASKGQEVMGGTFGSYQARVELSERIDSYSSQNRTTSYITKIFLYPNSDIGASLQIGYEGMGAKLLKKLGAGKDIEIGVRNFDDKFKIWSSDPSLPGRVLSPQVQDWMLWIRSSQPWLFQWGGRTAYASTRWTVWNADAMLYVLEVLQSVTEQLETIFPPVRKEGRNCQNCGKELQYVAQYDRWYCHSCQQYAPQDTQAHKREQKRSSPYGTSLSYSLSSIKGK